MPIWALLGLAGVGGYLLLSKTASASTPATPWSPGVPNPAAYPQSADTSPATPAAPPAGQGYSSTSGTPDPTATYAGEVDSGSFLSGGDAAVAGFYDPLSKRYY